MMTLTEAVKGTYAVIGQSMTDMELAMIVSDLSAYAPDAVMTALTRCRRELKRITLADIIDRLPGGHPGPEEAWAIVSKTLGDESVSIALTNEMARASAVSSSLANDPVAARMAFKECYVKLVSEARIKQQPPKWIVSLGWDTNGRDLAKMEAENRNKQAQLNPSLPITSIAPLESRTEK